MLFGVGVMLGGVLRPHRRCPQELHGRHDHRGPIAGKGGVCRRGQGRKEGPRDLCYISSSIETLLVKVPCGGCVTKKAVAGELAWRRGTVFLLIPLGTSRGWILTMIATWQYIKR